MVSKGEASKKLKEYLIYLEHQLGRQAKAVDADNGKEYLKNEFIFWCKETGINLQVTAPYSPMQNGIAKWFNRTLGELACAMRIANDVPPFLWPEAIAHAAYVQNQLHTHALVGSTPYKQWTGHQPNISHFKEFECPVWIMKEGVSINKLDTKSEKLTFVGFLDRLRAVQFYDTRARSVKTLHNFRFLKDPVSTPEHLLKGGCTTQ